MSLGRNLELASERVVSSAPVMSCDPRFASLAHPLLHPAPVVVYRPHALDRSYTLLDRVLSTSCYSCLLPPPPTSLARALLLTDPSPSAGSAGRVPTQAKVLTPCLRLPSSALLQMLQQQQQQNSSTSTSSSSGPSHSPASRSNYQQLSTPMTPQHQPTGAYDFGTLGPLASFPFGFAQPLPSINSFGSFPDFRHHPLFSHGAGGGANGMGGPAEDRKPFELASAVPRFDFSHPKRQVSHPTQLRLSLCSCSESERQLLAAAEGGGSE